MRIEEILIGSNPALIKRVEYMIHKNERGLLEALEKAEIPLKLVDTRPAFPSAVQAAYLKKFKIKPTELSNYRIYIGKEIHKGTEQIGGIELPIEVLYDDDLFYIEVIERIGKTLSRED